MAHSFISRRASLGLAASGVVQRARAEERTAIDLSRHERVFEENFETLDVSAWGPGTRWIAHTPWNGDFGDAAFADPTPGFPFTLQGGVLRIEARKEAEGRWRSGLLASVDPRGNGFAQRYGYFEMRAKLPAGDGVWPAFWLIGIDRSTHTAEIDIIEHHGHAPERFTSAVHVWDRATPAASRSLHRRNPVPRGVLYDRFNTFGAEVGPRTIRIFFNRQEVWQVPTPPQHRQPLFVLVNLGLGGGWPIEKTPNPSVMHVDYIHVWAPREPMQTGREE